jgi:hypothetical protein
MRRSTKILGVIAVMLIGLGGYGVYHASGLGPRDIVDGTVVEVKEHIGERPICVRNGRRSRRCLTLNATEPYGYATEVVEYTGPEGNPVRAEDPRERGGAREAVGDEVKVILHPDGSVEVAPKNSMLVSAGLLAGGVALLGLLVLLERSRRRGPADEVRPERAEIRGAGERAVPVGLRWPLWQVATAMGIITTLSAGVTVVVLRQPGNDYPKEWDPRVAELADFVQRERGALYEHPVPVDFLSPEEYSQRTRTEEGTLSDDDKAELEQFEGTMRALGLLAADVDLFKATNDLVDTGTLAFYDTAEKRVVVRGTEVTPGLAVTLAHELTHVLQDQIYGLDRYDDKEGEVTSGQTYAFGALAEADADRIEERYRDTLDQATTDAIDAESDAGLADFEAAGIPTALTSLFASPYALGDAFVAVLEATTGQSVDAAFSKPPTTEEQILDPFEYIAGHGPVPVKRPATDGAEVFDGGDFGAVSLMIVLAERIDPYQALAAATGWGGDSYAVFPKDGRTCFRLNVTGDTPEDTAELTDALTGWVAATPGGAASTSRDGDIVHLESCDPGAAAVAGTGGSEQAVQLAAARGYVAVGTLDEGATPDQAECFGSVVVNGLTLEEIAADELSPSLELKIAELVQACQ